MKRIASLLAVAVLVAACAGTPFKWEAARKIQPGMTTDEVVALLGKPNRITAAGGKTIYVWAYSRAGLTSVDTRSVAVSFVDGRAIGAPEIPKEFQD